MTIPSTPLYIVAPAFVNLAHEIVWCTVATVDAQDRPRTRFLHPMWQYDGETLTGFIATGPTEPKLHDLAHSPYLSCLHWTSNQDTCRVDCHASWAFNDETCTTVWNAFKDAPPPPGYDPAIIPTWNDGPTSDAFAVLQLTPHRIRVMPGTVLTGQGGEVFSWHT